MLFFLNYFGSSSEIMYYFFHPPSDVEGQTVIHFIFYDKIPECWKRIEEKTGISN
jgi:hypothetical protein